MLQLPRLEVVRLREARINVANCSEQVGVILYTFLCGADIFRDLLSASSGRLSGAASFCAWQSRAKRNATNLALSCGPELDHRAWVIRGSLIPALQAALSPTDAEAPQPVYILAGVVAPATVSAASERQRSEPLAEPEPARAYAELIGSFADSECMLLLKHAPTLKLADMFL